MNNPFETIETKIDMLLTKIETLESIISNSVDTDKSAHSKEFIHIDQLCKIFDFPKRETLYAFNHRVKAELKKIDKFVIKGAKGELFFPVETIDVIKKIKQVS
jgi:hypothetical protein